MSDSEQVQVRSAVDVAGVWEQAFAEYATGVESIAAICARLGLSPGAWYYWRKRLGIAPARPAVRERPARRRAVFTELVVQSEASVAPASVEIALASGVVVRVGAGAGERELLLALRALGAAGGSQC